MLELTFGSTIAGYLAAILMFYLALLRSATVTTNLLRARRVLIGALALHAIDIVLRSVVVRACPVQSAAFALSLAALVAAGGFLIWARGGRALSLGILVAPIALGMFVASGVLLHHGVITDVPGWFLALHVLANLSAVALFVIAAAAAILYLFQAGRLKSKRPAVSGFAFPGLSSLETLIARSLTWGLGPMTLGVVSGAVFAERLSQGGADSARIVLAYACWLGGTVLVVGQKLVGWNGRKLARGAIGLAVLAIAVVILYAITTEGPA